MRRAAPAIALAALLLLIGFFARHVVERGAVRPWNIGALSGDEPHYLVAINSLLHDGDLALTDDYGRAFEGGWEAGRRFRLVRLDHHTILYDGREHALWNTVFDWKTPLACRPPCVPFKRLSPRFPDDGGAVERSSHAVGFPILAAALL